MTWYPKPDTIYMCDNDAICPSRNHTTYIMFATTKNLPIVIVIGINYNVKYTPSYVCKE